MKRTLQQVGFVFGFIAAISLSAHAGHDHTARFNRSSHNCVLCHTPSLDTAASGVESAPTFTVHRLRLHSKTLEGNDAGFSSYSPRAPPVA